MMDSVSEEWLTLIMASTNPEVFLKAFGNSMTSKKSFFEFWSQIRYFLCAEF